MNSILAKQAPQMRPWPPMRVRQTMQTEEQIGEWREKRIEREPTPSGFSRMLNSGVIHLAHRHGRYDRAEASQAGSGANQSLMSEQHLLFDRKLLRTRRERFAHEIGAHEFLLDHVAREIAERVSLMLRSFPRALDLGAYKGLLGRKVAELPSVGEMIYAESAFALAALCRRPVLVCDEDLLPFKEASLNLIVSGLSLHRVNDLPGALIQIRRALSPDGLFIAGLLGARSLIELRQTLIEAEAETEGGASPRVAPFADVRDYGGLLQRAGFALPVADAEVMKVTYPSPRELMREIRVLGGGNVLAERSKAPLPRRTLDRAEAIYREHHATPDGGITATFEIVYLSGWTPDASQQKPLKPGSAAARLADALHTTEHSAGDKAAFPASSKRKDR
jgi:SAM-dependent methyltransferase